MSPATKFAATLLACAAVAAGYLGVSAAGRAPDPATEDISIDLTAPPVGRFVPDQAFGAAIDGLVSGRVDKLFTPHNERAILTAGLRPVSYSLRTELAIEAWHWGGEGAWSDVRHRQGYWTSSVHPRRSVMSGWGYFLPRRGDTTDQANDTGYSRLDDGDQTSFWKSNPYLDPAYAKAGDRPQWVIVSFPNPTLVSAAKIAWAAPFARQFSFQYWVGDNVNDDGGRWLPFPAGTASDGRGGDGTVRLSPAPIKVQYVRLLLSHSSHTALPGSADRRDAMGYAIREIGLGVIGSDGRFFDAMRHAPAGDDQTNVYVSSTDPWHRAIDRDPDVEQPGFDRVYGSGLTRGLPLMVSVGPLYDTPQNAAAEIRFLEARGYPIREVEIGEEPDGQNVSAEDFSDLYLQFAAAVHAVDPALRVGGPSLQDAVTDTWLDDNPDHAWTRRFVASLAAQGRMADLNFFSFEHYPYDTLCGRMDAKLVGEDAILASDVARLHAEGVPRTIPLVISEYGLSAFSGEGEVNLPGALFDADLVAHFLSLGGRGAYLLGYGPDEMFKPDQACAGYGELMLFGEDGKGQSSWPTPAYWASVMLANEWAQPGGGEHEVLAARQSRTSGSPAWVTAYPIRRPDGKISVLLINRDPAQAHQVSLNLIDRVGQAALPGPYDMVQYSPQQFAWRSAGFSSHPLRDDPPNRFTRRRKPGVATALLTHRGSGRRARPPSGLKRWARDPTPLPSGLPRQGPRRSAGLLW